MTDTEKITSVWLRFFYLHENVYSIQVVQALIIDNEFATKSNQDH